MLKLARSERAYKIRKQRGTKVDVDMARELLGQRLEIYFEDEARWRLGTVLEMRVDTVEGGTRIEVLHSVLYFGAEGAPIVWENLSHKRFVTLKSDLAAVEARRLALEEKRRRKAEEKQREKLEFAEHERAVFRGE